MSRKEPRDLPEDGTSVRVHSRSLQHDLLDEFRAAHGEVRYDLAAHRIAD
jgi:hypothetical protein